MLFWNLPRLLLFPQKTSSPASLSHLRTFLQSLPSGLELAAHPNSPPVSCHQSSISNSCRKSFAHRLNNDIDFQVPVSLTVSLPAQRKCLPLALYDPSHTGIFHSQRATKRNGFASFTSQKTEDQICQVCPNMRLNVKITLTSGNRILTPKFGFERQLSH